MKNLYLIGLTGNLGSGKSTVRKMLERLGARGIDADALAHVVMERGTATWSSIVDVFGVDVLAYDGRIDRRKLAQRVFSDPSRLAALEAIVHPAVSALIKTILRQVKEPVAVIEAIKLIEAGLHLGCDAVWVVKCAPEIEIARVMRDRHMSEAEARARLQAQAPIENKLRYAHVVIDNGNDEATTRAGVELAWNAINLADAGDKSELLPESATRRPASIPIPGGPVKPAELDPTASAGPAAPPVRLAPGAGFTAAAQAAMPDAAVSAPQPGVEIERAPETVEFEVRRARRSDLAALSNAIARRENRTLPLTRAEALKRLGDGGFRIATLGNRIVALATWDAENLVATIRDIWVESPDIAPIVLPKLFGLVEEEAKALLCEVVLLLTDPSAQALSAEAHAAGYREGDLDSLHAVWRAVVKERLHLGQQIWVKRLREGITTRPV